MLLLRQKVRYLPTKELVGIDGEFPFRFTTEWYDSQCEFMRGLDLTPYEAEPLFTQESVLLSEVILNKKKRPLCKNATLKAFGNHFEILQGDQTTVLAYKDVSAVTVLGKNKLNIYFDKKVWQFKGDKSMNALKFVNLFYHSKNVREGNPNGQFLGI